ncbi:helix-turn-helix domain-containing protein [Streptomyces sp. NPDC047315]|uniref:GbsR/MarR family transcriptional regulator n=1 Tax=Streptomyces sp. NPDC047315 TaxID=3155142 RepID=UPI0033FADADC
MPGGRLSHEERRAIAVGLAEGLGYAEIARRLDRPTSTVSREVARNGGRSRYRAEYAHRATGWRARRRGPTAPTPSPGREVEPEAVATAPDPAEAGAFREQFTEMMVATGLPRMVARVLTALFTTDSGSLTAAELVRGLRVSPASVSKAVGYLDGLDLLRREREAGRRHERYVIAEDVWFGAWSSSARTTAVWADTARRGAEVFDPTSRAGARLDQMALFFTRLSEDMAGGPVATAAGENALTVVAALAHAGVPLTAAELAAALDWPVDRVVRAIADAERHPDLTDPVTPRRVAPDAYALGIRASRLSATQCAALTSRAPLTTPRM